MRACVLVLTSVLLWPAGAAAQARPDWSGLDSPDPAQIGAAIDAVAASGRPDAVRALSERIARGLPSELLEKAVEALAAIGRGPALRTLSDLAKYRRASIRMHVARMLGDHKPNGAERILATLLDDPSGQVRGLAATALGEVSARSVMPTVIEAARRGVAQAAVVVGQQGRPADFGRILRTLDGAQLETFAPTLRVALLRPDLNRPTRLAIASKLGDLRHPIARRLLQEVLAQMPEGDDPIRAAVEEAIVASEEEPEEGDER